MSEIWMRVFAYIGIATVLVVVGGGLLIGIAVLVGKCRYEEQVREKEEEIQVVPTDKGVNDGADEIKR